MSVSILQLMGLMIFMLIPSFIAIKRGHPHKAGIILLNCFGVWFLGIGWILALFWCFITPESISNKKSKLEYNN